MKNIFEVSRVTKSLGLGSNNSWFIFWLTIEDTSKSFPAIFSTVHFKGGVLTIICSFLEFFSLLVLLHEIQKRNVRIINNADNIFFIFIFYFLSSRHVGHFPLNKKRCEIIEKPVFFERFRSLSLIISLGTTSMTLHVSHKKKLPFFSLK